MGSLNGIAPVPDHLSIGTVKDVAVIGAGISGVVSAAHLIKEGLNVTVFERTGVIGGVWHFDPRVDRDPPFPNTIPPDPNWTEIERAGLSKEEASLIHAPPGPCYSGLKNNVPTSLLRSSLLRWPEGTEDFIDQSELRKYIEDIARLHGVIDKILFHTRVERAFKPENSRQWTVESSTLLTNESSHSIKKRSWKFDAVVVASGHYHVPFVPDIPGLSTWKKHFPDRVMHSKKYRDPTPFRGRTVLLIGAGASSLDVAKDVELLGGKVYQSRRETKYDLTISRLPKTVERVAMAAEFIIDEAVSQDQSFGVDDDRVIPGKVRLEDGNILENIDYVVVATGYITTYPFLGGLEQPFTQWEDADEKVLITSDGYTTHNLHRDIFYIPDPSLAFIGVSHLVSTFSLFDFQAKVLSKVFSGNVQLPSRSAMVKEHKERKARFTPGDKFHTIPSGEHLYIRDLLDWVNQDLEKAGLKPIEGMDADWQVAYEAIKGSTKVFESGKEGEPSQQPNSPANVSPNQSESANKGTDKDPSTQLGHNEAR
ncbi:hypothetical protein F5X99DRAFT_367270 [Biscogniauxia marginata]|nr:hypothetical protein F5X99DRAFT_367270 [Biscogniauxia marginata]